ncbi:MAG: arylesterase [Methylophilaceae bacterium]|nr:MAG: arylesterase [Methylophilaceae bacterium]
MKKCIACCLFTLSLLACTTSQQLAAIPAGSTVVILGDSLSYGKGAARGEDYPSLLAERTDWHIVNAGVPGDTSAQGLARLPELLATHRPTLLMIVLGGNDFLRNINVVETEANIRAIIQVAKLNKVQAILVAIPNYQPVKAALVGLSDHPLYAKLAAETNVALVEEVFSEVLSNSALKADYVHPNAAGYQMIEAKLHAKLMALGLFKAQ